jgi:FkbM family methyltransferase
MSFSTSRASRRSLSGQPVPLQLRKRAVCALIYDIGLHDGRDTGHYLREGCRVVAVDANPAMCAAAEVQFQDYMRIGQLKIINCAVAESKGRVKFWVCDDVSIWSSLRRDLASRNGSMHHSIFVDCLPIIEIIDQFGVGDYMKIDIEGGDTACISGLTSAAAPRYISVELDHSDQLRGEQELQILAELGYQRFKIICQNNSWHQVTKRNIGFYKWQPDHFIIRRLRRLRAAPYRLVAKRRSGESGPWGEKTSGAWHSVDHAHSVCRSLCELHQRQGTLGLGWWFDIHARK